MNYRYHAILGYQLIIMRWSSDVLCDDVFIEALIDQMNKPKYEYCMDVSVVGDLLITDAPISNRSGSVAILEDAFAGDPDSLPEFILWEYKNGKFVTIKRREKMKISRFC